jgi:DNA uptake protein ComE-like DNA-binding protein
MEELFPPRRQWVAIAVLAAIIVSTLLGPSLYRDSTSSDVPSRPMMVVVEGEVREPGAYLLEGPEVTVSRALEVAGGLRAGSAKAVAAEVAERLIGSGQVVRVLASGQGPATIRIETTPAATWLTLGGKLNVNAASEEELMLVPQMKAGFAAAIVDRRGRSSWQGLDELEAIPGVGPKTVDKWKAYLEATDCGRGGLNEKKE